MQITKPSLGQRIGTNLAKLMLALITVIIYYAMAALVMYLVSSMLVILANDYMTELKQVSGLAPVLLTSFTTAFSIFVMLKVNVYQILKKSGRYAVNNLNAVIKRAQGDKHE